jgi:hypothetical protein
VSQPEQKITSLEGEDAIHVEKQRGWMREHFAPEAQHKYEVLEEKLRLLQTILDANWIEPGETWKLQSLGVTFGDALAQKLGLTWAAVDDEYGRSPALMVPKTTILLFPLTAISKRVEKGEQVDVHGLFDRFCELVEARKATDKLN